MMRFPFIKMQGIGNDFIMVDLLRPDAPRALAWDDYARKVCDRHFGIGSDGTIMVLPSDTADFRMRMFNPDGSEAEMCGNGIRCFARYVYDRGYAKAPELTIETLAGIKAVRLTVARGKVSGVRINMGVPAFGAAQIPVSLDLPVVKDYPLAVGERTFAVSCVSVGNPHAVIFLGEEEVIALPLAAVGPLVEHHPIFPERTNTEYCAVLDRRRVRVRVWERGAGKTLACGTGATASAVSAIEHGFVESKVEMILDGGRLLIEWLGEGQPAFMTGPAEYICEGEYYYER